MNNYIDHTLLRPDKNSKDYSNLINEAEKYKFYSVCVPPTWVNFAVGSLKNTSVKIATVIGFPHGNSNIITKKKEIEYCYFNGAREFDIVIDISKMKTGNWVEVEEEVREMRKAVKKDAIIKYIIEISYLTEFEIRKICEILMENNIEFVKTSTGYGPRDTTVDDIKLLKSIVGNRIKIKASGGIKDLQKAKEMIAAGAERVGTSSSVSIMEQLKLGGIN